MKMKIYKLCKGTKVCYVGKTKQTLEARFNQHMAKKNLPSHEYSIELICEVDDEMASTIENLSINSYDTIINGLNKISGKGKMSENVKAHKLTQAEAVAKSKIKASKNTSTKNDIDAQIEKIMK